MFEVEKWQRKLKQIQSGDSVKYLKFVETAKDEIRIDVRSWKDFPEDDRYSYFEDAIEIFINYILDNKTHIISDSVYIEALKASNRIFMNTQRSGGNVFIGSPYNIERLIKDAGPHLKFDTNTNLIGRFFVIPYPPLHDKMIVTYMGSREFDGGVIFHEKNGKYFPILNEDCLKFYEVLVKSHG